MAFPTVSTPEPRENKSDLYQIRLTPSERAIWDEFSRALGFKSVSKWIRSLTEKDMAKHPTLLKEILSKMP